MDAHNCYDVVRVAHDQSRDRLRRAEVHEALQQAGVDQRGWAHRYACRFLAALGRLMIAAGERLDRAGMSPDEKSALPVIARTGSHVATVQRA